MKNLYYVSLHYVYELIYKKESFLRFIIQVLKFNFTLYKQERFSIINQLCKLTLYNATFIQHGIGRRS